MLPAPLYLAVLEALLQEYGAYILLEKDCESLEGVRPFVDILFRQVAKTVSEGSLNPDISSMKIECSRQIGGEHSGKLRVDWRLKAKTPAEEAP